jgi:DNA polymerase sigma|tara:strand:+ start:1859 stop:2053 length:195 start_codon:yes stop_codon:yes gene_type:complete
MISFALKSLTVTSALLVIYKLFFPVPGYSHFENSVSLGLLFIVFLLLYLVTFGYYIQKVDSVDT